MNNKEEVNKLLKFDGLAEAEKQTGESYKEDELTKSLGLLYHIENNQKKDKLLSALGDSTFSNTEANYLKIVESIGFESVLVVPFTNEDNIEERLHVMWQNDYSILLVFDTHTWGDDGSWARSGKTVPPPSINGGNFYYNWSPNNRSGYHCLCSGGFVSNGDSIQTYGILFNPDFTPHILPQKLRRTEPKFDWECYDKYKVKFNKWSDKVHKYIKANNLIKIWSGNHDCREAIKFNINQMIEQGTFVKNWVETPFLWLLHYMDTKTEDYDYKQINQTRIAMLPEHVRKAIGL